MSLPTMVLPVPGLPWKSMCRLLEGGVLPCPLARFMNVAYCSRPLMVSLTFSKPTISSSMSSSDELVWRSFGRMRWPEAFASLER